MKQKIIETIKKYNLINSGDKIVLGVSGGPDSIAMLDILNQLKDEMNFEIYQNINELEKGIYQLSASIQGGDAGDSSIMKLIAETKNGYYEKEFMVQGWANWQTPVISNIPIDDGIIKISVQIKAPGGAWGTIDDFELVRTDI